MKNLLFFNVCITTTLSTQAMMGLVEYNKSFPLLHEKERQFCYQKWNQLTETQEFIRYIQLIQQHYDPTNVKCKKAFHTLRGTKKFQEYENSSQFITRR